MGTLAHRPSSAPARRGLGGNRRFADLEMDVDGRSDNLELPSHIRRVLDLDGAVCAVDYCVGERRRLRRRYISWFMYIARPESFQTCRVEVDVHKSRGSYRFLDAWSCETTDHAPQAPVRATAGTVAPETVTAPGSNDPAVEQPSFGGLALLPQLVVDAAVRVVPDPDHWSSSVLPGPPMTVVDAVGLAASHRAIAVHGTRTGADPMTPWQVRQVVYDLRDAAITRIEHSYDQRRPVITPLDSPPALGSE